MDNNKNDNHKEEVPGAESSPGARNQGWEGQLMFPRETSER